MDKQNTLYPYNRILFARKMDGLLIHATTQMDLENITKGNHKSNILYNLLYTEVQNRKSTGTESRFVVA
jgi:hypothetical protein